MLVSTKGRYALRVMIELARRSDSSFVRLDSIAEAQDISEKYLESIVSVLVKHHLIEGLRGRGGGYRLTRKPSEYPIGEILRCAEGSLAPVSCLSCDTNTCARADVCTTLPMWKKLDGIIENYLDGVTLDDLLGECSSHGADGVSESGTGSDEKENTCKTAQTEE